ncbi:Solute carrier family 22 member 6 [Pteropus alecto]|uniref:Solute carrier family 22 member 6 n=1 Tax=Pteropus alecto TaxID=9402 RepID=L5KR41_PTEAL|nr:Solute carrier family 22 member 6 [Pteropus alecto]
MQQRERQQPLSSRKGTARRQTRTRRSGDRQSSASRCSAGPGPMAFNDLLQQLGGFGRFQQIQVTLIVLPMLLMSSQITLQNFTAAVPTHHGFPPADASLSKDGELEAWLLRDRQGRPESGLRFTSPPWGPPLPNGTDANGTRATEPCASGWIYDNSSFPSTIVTEVRLLGPPAPPLQLLHPHLTIPPHTDAAHVTLIHVDQNAGRPWS